MSCEIFLPPNLRHLTVGGKSSEFWLLQGIGIAESVWSETNIGSTRNSYNQISSVHSSSTTKREIWVRLANGKEKQISLPDDTSFAVREGHQLSLICMKSKFLSHNSFYYMGIVNHTTDCSVSLDNTWMFKKFAGTDSGAVKSLANVFVLFTLGLGLIPLAIYSKSIAARYVKPMNQRIKDIASYCFKLGFQAAQG